MPSSNMTKTTVHGIDVDSQTKPQSKSLKRMYYPSNQKGRLIVNAVTGDTYPWKSDSINSLRLFRVVDSTGKCDNQGYYDRKGNHSESFNKDPNILYYDGPNEYMTHRKTKVSPMLISEWNETRRQLFTNGTDLNLAVYHKLKALGKITATLKQ